METFWRIVDFTLRIIGFLSIPLILWTIFHMVRTLRKPHPIRIKSLVVQMLIPVGTLIIYGFILGVEPPRLLSAFLLAVGLVAGVLTSRTTAMQLQGETVVGTRSAWFLLAWGASFTITQLMAIVASPELASWGFSTMYFSLGLTLATNGSLLYHRQMTTSGAAATTGFSMSRVVAVAQSTLAAQAPQASVGCHSCGTTNPAGARFCVGCGARLA